MTGYLSHGRGDQYLSSCELRASIKKQHKYFSVGIIF